jgi:uncharacterized protein YkwD
MTKFQGRPTTSNRRAGFAARACVTAAATAVVTAGFAGVPAAAGAAPVTNAGLRAAVVELTNAARAVKGCKPLKRSARLGKAAQGHADDMAARAYFSHTSADGTAWNARIRLAGWKKPGGENIAYGYEDAAGVVEGWLNSPGHRRNMLNCSFAYIGVGVSAGGEYWVQDFGY